MRQNYINSISKRRKLNFYICLLFSFCYLALFTSASSQSINSYSEPQSKEALAFSTNNTTLLGNNSSDFSYKPFQWQNENQFPNAILYGPGGDPIGGLPIGDGILALLLSVFVYWTIKIQKKKNNIN